MPRRLSTRRSVTTTMVLVGTAAAVAIGATVVAQSGEDTTPDPPPGVPAPRGDRALIESVNTGGGEFDPSILTKFLPGHAFDPHQSDGLNDDLANYDVTGSCIAANALSAGSDLELRAGVELPDGARIKQMTFFGRNDDADETIVVRLLKTTVNVPTVVGPPLTAVDSTVDSFTVPAGSGAVALSGADDLSEYAGSRFVSVAGGTDHYFHSIRLKMQNSADRDQEVCGVEVTYQVPTSADPGSVFHPLAGYRAYDSRLDMAPVANGRLAAGDNRVIPVADGRDVGTGVIDLPDAIPATAVAVTYTVTAAGPTNAGFLFVGPGDASAITASNLNWGANTSGAIANSGTVTLDASGQVKVFGGGPGSSTDFIIDVTGYYAPADYPNMGN